MNRNNCGYTGTVESKSGYYPWNGRHGWQDKVNYQVRKENVEFFRSLTPREKTAMLIFFGALILIALSGCTPVVEAGYIPLHNGDGISPLQLHGLTSTPVITNSEIAVRPTVKTAIPQEKPRIRTTEKPTGRAEKTVITQARVSTKTPEPVSEFTATDIGESPDGITREKISGSEDWKVGETYQLAPGRYKTEVNDLPYFSTDQAHEKLGWQEYYSFKWGGHNINLPIYLQDDPRWAGARMPGHLDGLNVGDYFFRNECGDTVVAALLSATTEPGLNPVELVMQNPNYRNKDGGGTYPTELEKQLKDGGLLVNDMPHRWEDIQTSIKAGQAVLVQAKVNFGYEWANHYLLGLKNDSDRILFYDPMWGLVEYSKRDVDFSQSLGVFGVLPPKS